ncbi:MAG: dipeptide ABC transporter ATP-binding protein DppD [Desulfuromonadales bacterium C00003096]|jgi:peptide/nickel transport system ATP-binding protein|nr:MAG: dipeptide ABC transporter ATP-binding protein DppD [Desulfuromonadales bacterium C00003096]
MSLLSITHLKTWFPSRDGIVKAVNAVTLEIKENERFGLIGETGSGKTILGMTIMRLLQPDTRIKGEIVYKGHDLLKLSEEEMRKIRGKEIAMILQNPATSLNPVLKVGDQIAEAIRLHQGLDKRAAKEKVVEMLEAVKILSPEKRVNEYPHEFSGGMKERVMIAMALACDPSLIIADEPTTGLDVTIKMQIVRLMKEVTKQRAMLFITHDLDAAAEICDNIAVMYAGELVEYAKTEEIFKNPIHPYTQGFLNSLPNRGLKAIRGMSPSLIGLPTGCRFHPRCDHAEERCKINHPELVEIETGHFVRCLQYD